MKNLTRMTASSLCAYGLVYASKASADASQGWGYTNAPTAVPTDIEAAIMNITNYVLGFITIVATLIIIYGGILYLTAAGNQDQIGKAKTTIVYGIVGIIICGLAYAMVIVVSTVILSGGTSGA
jgi:intracellular septation protein A